MQIKNGEDLTLTVSLGYSNDDGFGRLTDRETLVDAEGEFNSLFRRNEHLDYQATDAGTSMQISIYSVYIGEPGSDLGQTYYFTYDANGNITEISDNMGDTLCRYEYDGLGQLVREYNMRLGRAYVYTYDKAGNITSRAIHEFTGIFDELGTLLQTDTYTYGNTSWGDQLTAYKGNSITYDTIGNPTQIAIGAGGGYNLTWQGRRLLNYTGYGTENGTSLSFTYNEDGIRTSKTVNGVTHTYFLNGSQVFAEQWGDNVLLYLYDENGAPMGLAYRNDTHIEGTYTYYYFDKNLQGDIVGIYKDGNVLVGTYTYDAWGNFTVYANSTSELDLLILNSYNPFRYRGYYYDVETGLYYLQSRYYNPEWGRFINADGQLNPGSDILGANLFAYCVNNPVNLVDYSGNAPDWNLFVQGALLVAIGVGVAAATILTAGAATVPLCTAGALAASALTTAAVTTAVIGASEIAESFTGNNVIKDGVGEENYNFAKNIAITITSLGMAYLAGGGTFDICFVAGTPIKTADGNKAIEQIQPGDMVWATNEQTGDTELKSVVRTFVNQADELIHITVNNEEIVCTTEHPFYSPVKGWIAACQLRAGDILVLLNGEYVVVEQVQHELLETPITVYNFEVEGFHTYYVGSTGVLAHNSCNHTSSWHSERKSHWKSEATKIITNNQQGMRFDSYTATAENINRMQKGLAPIGWDGYSVQLHHPNGIANDFYNYKEVSKTLHNAIHVFFD